MIDWEMVRDPHLSTLIGIGLNLGICFFVAWRFYLMFDRRPAWRNIKNISAIALAVVIYLYTTVAWIGHFANMICLILMYVLLGLSFSMTLSSRVAAASILAGFHYSLNLSFQSLLMVMVPPTFFSLNPLQKHPIVFIGHGLLMLLLLSILYLCNQNHPFSELSHNEDIIIAVIVVCCTMISTYIFIIMATTDFLVQSIIQLITMLFLIIAYFCWYWWSKQQTEKTRISYFMSAFERLSDEVSGYQDQVKQLAYLKHDINKYYDICNQLLLNKQYNEVQAYLEQFKDDMCLSELAYVHTGNVMLDALLQLKKNEATNENIQFEVDCRGEFLNLYKYNDLVLAVFNLLDNAFAAAKKCDNPYVKVQLNINKNQFCFVIENNCKSAEEKQKVKNSEKRYGLRIVRDIANLYGGDIILTIDDNVACAVFSGYLV